MYQQKPEEEEKAAAEAKEVKKREAGIGNIERCHAHAAFLYTFLRRQGNLQITMRRLALATMLPEFW